MYYSEDSDHRTGHGDQYWVRCRVGIRNATHRSITERATIQPSQQFVDDTIDTNLWFQHSDGLHVAFEYKLYQHSCLRAPRSDSILQAVLCRLSSEVVLLRTRC